MGFFSRDSVRICALFGLRLALCPRFCPYYHSFRTQNRSVPAVLSLLPSIRTQHGSVPAVLSLLPLFSDSARLCARGSVPITLYSDSARLCARGSVPITTLFGLGMVLCPQFCPYYHSFRTLRGSVPAVLALLPLFSDSARFCARSSVPITTLFGLSTALCPRFCPYYTSIRTQHSFCARSSVPITTLFGLSAALYPQFCPNLSPIWIQWSSFRSNTV